MLPGKCKACFKAVPQPNCASTALLLLRFVAGLAFIYHGWGKIQSPMSWMPAEAPIPGILQLLAAVAEFGGGIAWILGLLTPLASFGIFCTMVVAACMHKFAMGDPFIASGPGQTSYELAAVYLAISVALFTLGPGKFSLDAKIFGNRD